jgi:benzoate-CoA ligase family protein
VQPHRSFVNTAQCYARQVLCYREQDVTLSVPKLYFGYATGSNLLFPFAAGASSVLFDDRCTAEVVFGRIARHQPTILITVPTMINQMVSHPEAGRQDLSCLRLATSAGEGLPEELHARWDRTFGVPLLDGLGTAEQWHIFLSNRLGRVRQGTLGEVVPGYAARVVDKDGRELPDGETGRLWIEGDTAALMYWQAREKSLETYAGDVVMSGDLFARDADGFFHYRGRADDLLKVGGIWVAPQEIEHCLAGHPDVADCAVVGYEEDGLQKPRAFVVLRDGATVDAESLQTHVKSRLSPHKYPRDVRFVAELPRTGSGKVDRRALREVVA